MPEATKQVHFDIMSGPYGCKVTKFTMDWQASKKVDKNSKSNKVNLSFSIGSNRKDDEKQFFLAPYYNNTCAECRYDSGNSGHCTNSESGLHVMSPTKLNMVFRATVHKIP